MRRICKKLCVHYCCPEKYAWTEKSYSAKSVAFYLYSISKSLFWLYKVRSKANWRRQSVVWNLLLSIYFHLSLLWHRNLCIAQSLFISVEYSWRRGNKISHLQCFEWFYFFLQNSSSAEGQKGGDNSSRNITIIYALFDEGGGHLEWLELRNPLFFSFFFLSSTPPPSPPPPLIDIGRAPPISTRPRCTAPPRRRSATRPWRPPRRRGSRRRRPRSPRRSGWCLETGEGFWINLIHFKHINSFRVSCHFLELHLLVNLELLYDISPSSSSVLMSFYLTIRRPPWWPSWGTFAPPSGT